MPKAHLINETLVAYNNIFDAAYAAKRLLDDDHLPECTEYIVELDKCYDDVKNHLLSLKDEYKDLADCSKPLYAVNKLLNNDEVIKEYNEYFKIRLDIFKIYTIYFVKINH